MLEWIQGIIKTLALVNLWWMKLLVIVMGFVTLVDVQSNLEALLAFPFACAMYVLVAHWYYDD